jgi:hypothetical protein
MTIGRSTASPPVQRASALLFWSSLSAESEPPNDVWPSMNCCRPVDDPSDW